MNSVHLIGLETMTAPVAVSIPNTQTVVSKIPFPTKRNQASWRNATSRSGAGNVYFELGTSYHTR